MNNSIFYFFYNDIALSHQSVFLNGVIIFFADILPYILIGAAGLFYYIVFDPQNNYESFVQSFIQKHKEIVIVFSAGVVAWGLSKIIKILIHAERPFLVLKDVIPLSAETGFSFPSSHAALFAAVSVTIFFKHKKLGYLFMFLTLLMGVARIMAGFHFPTDILGGLVLGSGVAVLAQFLSLKFAYFK